MRWFHFFRRKPTLQGFPTGTVHFAPAAPHLLMLEEHGPDVPSAFWMRRVLPITTSAAFGRSEPLGWYEGFIQESRN